MPKAKSSSKRSTKKSSPKKKTSTKSKASAVPSINSRASSSVSIRKAENGYVVSVDKSTKDNYISKQYIASSKKKAKAIASRAL